MPIDALTSAEISLPTRPDAARVRDRIAALATHVDLVGLTDNHAGQPRMSPLAAVALAREQGVATVVHVSCRDRNRLALRSQVVGAAALGSDGILCLYGDPVPGVPRVRDYTTTKLLAEARGWAEPHDLALGCVADPFAADAEAELALLGRKAAAGADFVQTQMVFDPAGLADFLDRARESGKPGGCGARSRSPAPGSSTSRAPRPPPRAELLAPGHGAFAPAGESGDALPAPRTCPRCRHVTLDPSVERPAAERAAAPPDGAAAPDRAFVRATAATGAAAVLLGVLGTFATRQWGQVPFSVPAPPWYLSWPYYIFWSPHADAAWTLAALPVAVLAVAWALHLARARLARPARLAGLAGCTAVLALAVAAIGGGPAAWRAPLAYVGEYPDAVDQVGAIPTFLRQFAASVPTLPDFVAQQP